MSKKSDKKDFVWLTTDEKHPHGAEGVSLDRLTGRYCRGKFEATACVERLHEYEKLGLTPDEVKENQKKLARYEKAEKEGRLAVLKCKVGDTLLPAGKDGGSEQVLVSRIRILCEGDVLDESGQPTGKQVILESTKLG